MYKYQSFETSTVVENSIIDQDSFPIPAFLIFMQI